MDTLFAGLIGSLITGIAAIIAAYIQSDKSIFLNRKSPKNEIIGTWLASGEGLYDKIEIDKYHGRHISGKREYLSKSGEIINYIVTGYFDGFLMSLAITGTNEDEGRVLSIFLRRIGKNEFEGIRTYVPSGEDISNSELYTWIKQ